MTPTTRGNTAWSCLRQQWVACPLVRSRPVQVRTRLPKLHARTLSPRSCLGRKWARG